MPDQRKTTLGKAFAAATAPYHYIRDTISRHIGYDVAMRGWDNDAPMDYPKARALKDAFKTHARPANLPLLVIDPVARAALVKDLGQIFRPDPKSALLPKSAQTTLEQDLARFRPDPGLKARLQESTAHDTSRSFMQSSMKILSMYWAKAGVKEVSIATVLGAATLYCTLKSVDVQATFSYWGRNFNDFLMQAFTASGDLKTDMLAGIKSAFDMNLYDSDLMLLKTIISESAHNFDKLDVTSAIKDIRVAPDVLQNFAQSVQSRFGDLALEHFIGGQNKEVLEELARALPIPSEHIDSVVEQITTAVVNEADVKNAAQIVVEKAAEHFGAMDPATFQTLEGATNQFNEIQRQLTTLDIKAHDTLSLSQILSYNGADAAYEAMQTAVNAYSPAALNPDEIGPERVKFLSELAGNLKSQINDGRGAMMTMLQNAGQGQKIIAELGELMSRDITATTTVTNNVERLTTEMPRSFGSLLGQFLMYALPASFTAQHLALRWGTWMSGKITNEWNKYGAAYKIKYEHTNVDNPDQRISENLSSITNFATDITTDGMQNALTLMAFLPILNAMGDFNPSVLGGPDIMIPNFMSWAALGYASVGAGALAAITYSLPKLGRKMQNARGDVRAGLISVHSQPEQIALAGGEKVEKGLLKNLYRKVVDVDVELINKRMQIMAFNSVQGNIGNYVPYMFTVPLGMAAMLTFGQAMQAAGIFRTVESSIEFIKRSIPAFMSFKSDVDRLAQLIDGIELAKYETLEKEFYRRQLEAGVAIMAPDADDDDDNITPDLPYGPDMA